LTTSTVPKVVKIHERAGLFSAAMVRIARAGQTIPLRTKKRVALTSLPRARPVQRTKPSPPHHSSARWRR
jgi:hypothetical protein